MSGTKRSLLASFAGLAVGSVFLTGGFCSGTETGPAFPGAEGVGVHDSQAQHSPISSNDHRGEEDILRSAFTDSLMPGEQIYPPISSLDGIYEANKSLMLPVEHFFDAYEKLEILNASQLVLDQGSTKVLKLTYQLADRQYHAYAYCPDDLTGTKMAALIIPGSGLNVSFPVYKKDRSSYCFSIIPALGNSCDNYVLIKPNEDCLAFHNGKKKLHLNYFVNWLLENGSSYSAHYITGSLAVTKYLQERYDKVVVAGLSQGGRAALLSSLQSQPDAAIIASGFTILRQKVQAAAHNQIIIPGLRNRFGFDAIRSRIQKSPTRYLFTYGQKEHGTYKMEAEERLTEKFLSGCPNVECKSHSGGHIFPTEIIGEFLSKHGIEP